MIEYASLHWDKLLQALMEHLEMVSLTLVISVVAAGLLTVLSMYWQWLGNVLVPLFSGVYAIPSLALFSIMIPVTGLGMKTAVIVLILYNQYLLLRNFLAGLKQVDPAVVEAAIGMGMSPWQVLFRVRFPLAKRALFTGIHLATVSTIGIGTIAAAINAGGLGSLLLDGLRTMNTDKIIWGSLLSAGLAILANAMLSTAKKRMG